MKPKPIIEAGSESSIWFRAMRMLFEFGKPLSPMTLLACQIPDGSTHLFGCITQTGKDRLIFWPPLPSNVQMLSADGRKGVTDHVTLELANGQSHVTSFDAVGKRNHHRNRWSMDVREGNALSLWFTLMVPFSTLREQDTTVSAAVPMPTTDRDRRLEEFRKHAATCRVETVILQTHEFAGDYLFCPFYLLTGGDVLGAAPQINLRQLGVAELAQGFRDDVPFWLSPLWLPVGDSRVVAFAAAPPGAANTDIMCGFPQPR